MDNGFITGHLKTSSGSIPMISTAWSRQDVWNTIKVRWSVGRMNYKVDPGIYAIGDPGENSYVFVTANFKLTFDIVRRALAGIDAWLLVLDTNGINVWCAAGKGTFSTNELIRRIQSVDLDKTVNHHKIIVPQLGAVGVAAHEVKHATGFSVIYGPVRVADIPAFIDAGLQATTEMRTVLFPLRERLKLVPVEMANGGYYLLLIPALLFILSGINPHGYSFDIAYNDGLRSFFNLLVAYLSGCAITPVILPWLPFRRFSIKGLIVGLLAALILFYFHVLGQNNLEVGSWFLMMGGLSSFLAMNFTGTSTFTSLSGVKKEMKKAVPLQIGMTGLGILAWIFSKFISL